MQVHWSVPLSCPQTIEHPITLSREQKDALIAATFRAAMHPFDEHVY
jgi:hypothetical protein